MINSKFQISFTSEVWRVKQVVIDILNFISLNIPSLTSEDRGDLKLIFSELLFNAVIHGNSQDSSKNVHVKVEISDMVIFSKISDEGIGFDYLKLLSTVNEDLNLDGEGGRGIHLVYSLTDSMAFNVKGNEIKFYKRVTSNG